MIVCNPGIFFKDNAPAVYPWILDKLGKGEEASTIQVKYEARKSDDPGLLPEMAELFKGVESINMVCCQYCWEYGRREVFEILRRFNDCGHRCLLVTSLPREICDELYDICGQRNTYLMMHVASCVIPTKKDGCVSSYDCVLTRDRESRKEYSLELINYDLKHGNLHDWDDVLVIGQSLADIPLGKAVQEKGGRFISFHPKDTAILNATELNYVGADALLEAFSWEGII